MTVSHTSSLTHHDAPVAHAIPGVGQACAYWVSEDTLAWPADLLPSGVVDASGTDPAPGVTFSLLASPTGAVTLTDGLLDLGDDGREIPLTLAGRLPDVIVEDHPQLRGYLTLSTRDAHDLPALDRGQIAHLLTGQLRVIQRTDGAVGGWVTAFTGVQTWPIIDVLYGRASARDGSAPLGSWFPRRGSSDGAPAFALWAPTAQSVTLLAWPTGDPTGSLPLVPGDPLRIPAHGPAGTTPAARHAAPWDGRWTVPASSAATAGLTPGSQYLWEVVVYVPQTGRVETNLVTDPYSRALTLGSRRSVAVDLDQRPLKPASWCENLSPVVVNDCARAIYELHVRDFSAADHTVPPELRGTYAAFGVDSAGTRHLRDLARAGIDTLHLLPVFDIATIPEDRADQRVADIPAGASSASRRPQAAIAQVCDVDAYNWGYDPYHWMAPEGSYAPAGHQDGGARVAQVRDMIGHLHSMGLQVVLDQVYNHTAASGQEPHSVLDRIVPGYYHRLDSTGAIEHSTCANNIATERAMAERLMIDSCVAWVRDYRVDGFRFDLMGYHSVRTMRRLKDALAQVADDAVGHDIYLYGEGWNMGEVADNALFRQATQGQVGSEGGLHLGTFNDRVRDAVYGGSHFDPDLRVGQGFGTGAVVEPNGHDRRPSAEQRQDLAWRTNMLRLSLAGNLRTFNLRTGDGTWRRGDEVRYGDDPAAYGDQPVDSLAYVESHDNETLFDRLVYKMPATATPAERARMQIVCLAAVTLGQTPTFWAAGTELLRSKSLDADSYDSGDYFNAIDWSGVTNGWGQGLPLAKRNFERWVIQAELLARPNVRPGPEDIALTRAMALDLLRLRRSTPLLSLGSASLIRERVSFLGGGARWPEGLIVMAVDDGAGPEDIDPSLDGLAVVINARPGEVSVHVSELLGRFLHLHPIQMAGMDEVVKATRFDTPTGTLTVPGRTAALLIEP